MTTTGVVHSVQVVTLGSRLAADAAVSSTSLLLEDVTDFAEASGTLSLNGAQYAYTTADFETATITLATGLTQAAVTWDRVDVWPVTPQKLALVMVTGAEDALTARVPHALMDRVSEGIRLDGERETVEYVDHSGELVITDVLGKDPLIDGSYIDPATLPPPGTDGVPPASSPTPTATGGIGAVHVRWTPVANADAVTYRLYGSTTSGFTPGPGNLLVSTTGSSHTHRPVPADYAATYHYLLIAADGDGDGPVSGQASAQLMQVSGPDIAAGYVYAGTIVVDQLLGGTLASDVLLSSTISTRGGGSGAGVDLGVGGLTIFDALGNPATVLSPEGSTFRGNAELAGVTVTGGAAFRGEAEIAPGATLRLASGVTAPKSPPSAVIDWASTAMYPTYVDTTGHGLVWKDSRWWTIDHAMPNVVDSSCIVSFDPVTGAEVDRIDLVGGGGSPYSHQGGLAWSGTFWYTLSVSILDGSWNLIKWSPTGAFQNGSAYAPISPGGGTFFETYGIGQMALTFDAGSGTILVAEHDDAGNRFQIESRNAGTCALSGTFFTNAVAGFVGPVAGIIRGTFTGMTGSQTVIVSRNNLAAWVFDTATLTYNSSISFPTPTNMLTGFGYDGTNFYSARFFSSGSSIYKHTNQTWTSASDDKWWAGSTWRDTDPTGGLHETDLSPKASFTMKKRARLTLTDGTIPDNGGTDDPDSVAFYLGRGSTAPARTAMWQQSLPAVGVNMLSVTAAVTSGTNPPLANNFPAAVPGLFTNTDGSLSISGTGAATLASATVTGAAQLNGATQFGGGTTIDTLRYGFASATVNGSGQITVTHNCGATPTAVLFGPTAWYIRMQSSTSTTFTVECRAAATNAIVTSGTVTFSWLALVA